MPRPRLHHPQIRQSVFKNPFQSSPFGHAIPRRAAGMGTNGQRNRSIPTFQSSLQQGGYALSVLRHAQRAIGIGIHQIILHINTWFRRQFQGYGRPSLGNAHAVGQRAVGIIQTIAGKHAGGPVRPQQLPAQRQIQTDSQRSLNNSLPHQHGGHAYGIQAGGTAARQHVIRPANSQFDADAGSKFAMQGIGNGQNFHGPPSRPRAQPSGSIPAGTAHNQGGIPQFLPSPSGILHGLARQQQRQLGGRAVPAAA